MAEKETIEINTFNPRRVLVISLVLGLVAGFANCLYLGGVGDSSITVYKAKAIVKAGDPFTIDNFEPVRLSGDVENIKQIAVTLGTSGAYLNREITETVNGGDLLLTRSFGLSGEGGIRESIGEKERAVPVPVKEKFQDLRRGNVVDIYGTISGKKVVIATSLCIKSIGNAYLVPNDDIKQQKYASVIVFIPEEAVADFLSNISAAEASVDFALLGGKCGEPARTPTIAKAYTVKPDTPANSRPADPDTGDSEDEPMPMRK